MQLHHLCLLVVVVVSDISDVKLSKSCHPLSLYYLL